MAVKRGLLNYNNGLITLTMRSSQIQGLTPGDRIEIRNARSSEIEYTVKDPNQWQEGDPIMDPNKRRADGLVLVHNPNKE